MSIVNGSLHDNKLDICIFMCYFYDRMVALEKQNATFDGTRDDYSEKLYQMYSYTMREAENAFLYIYIIYILNYILRLLCIRVICSLK